MEKRLKINSKMIFLALTVIVGLVVGIFAKSVAFAFSTQDYAVNKNNQTYGTAGGVETGDELPDLIAAIGEDGTKGYVRADDLYGNLPSSPEEAVALMHDSDYLDGGEIDLYASDGVTVIGKFLISPANGIETLEDGTTIEYNPDGYTITTYPNGATEITSWSSLSK